MNKNIFHLALSLIFFSAQFYAQKNNPKLKGDVFFEKYSFYEALEKYKEIDKDSISIDELRKLAKCYQFIDDLENSEAIYSVIIADENCSINDLYNYASVLRMNKKYKESNSVVKMIQKKSPNDSKAAELINGYDNLDAILNSEDKTKIFNLSINSEEQDFGPSFYGKDKIVFASSKQKTKSIKRTYNWNQMNFLDIYFSEIDSNELVRPKEFDKKVNNKMHEGPASFNEMGTFMAYTSNNYNAKSKDGTIKLEIHFCKKNQEGKWIEESSFKLNNPEYSVGHPCLSKDGNTMYFTSDLPGGYGGTDIYKIEKINDTIWGLPINLGDKINTNDNEMFPFFEEKQKVLFFASNGHYGLGGLDIFYSKLNNGSFKKIKNIGSPLNSNKDDFSLIIESNYMKGYFTSNRAGGKGDDDIYSFNLTKPLNFGNYYKGQILDENGKVISNASIQIKNNKGIVIKTFFSDENGSYEFELIENISFDLVVSKENYIGNKTSIQANLNQSKIEAIVLKNKPDFGISALVNDARNGKAISGVKITLTNLNNGEIDSLVTNELGEIEKALENINIYDTIIFQVKLEKKGYFTKSVKYSEKINSYKIYKIHENLNLSLDPEVKDLSEMVKINPIKFDFNKFNIREDAAIELNKIVEIMNQYPNMVVELGSHTDSRGSAAYNEKLSDKRAKASAAYIKGRISNPERIYGKGYGESKILNNCVDGVKCSDEEHEENRRTEFKVISTGSNQLKINNSSTDTF